VDPRASGWALGLLLAVIAGAIARPLRARGWIGVWLAYLAMLLPVLPLANHTYHYYLAAALPCAAAALALLLDATVAGVPRSTQWTAGAVLAAVLAVNGAELVNTNETMPLTPAVPALRADPTVDRARIASTALPSLAAARLPPHARLVFWSPASDSLERARLGSAYDSTRETYWERNVRAALLDGFAVRVMDRRVDSVRFVRAFAMPGDSAAVAETWALYAPDGSLAVFPAPALAARLGARP